MILPLRDSLVLVTLLCAVTKAEYDTRLIKVSHLIHLPVGELTDLPCDPLLSHGNTSAFSGRAAEWYDIGGFYVHSGFLLPVRPVSETLALYGVVCRVRGPGGSVVRAVEHRISVYRRPAVLWAFRVVLAASRIFVRDSVLSQTAQLKFLALSDKLNVLCEQNPACFYQFSYFHKSTFQNFLLNNDDGGDLRNVENVKINSAKLDGDAVPLTFYFKVGFSDYDSLRIDPESSAYLNHVVKLQKMFKIQLEESAIDIFIDKSLFFDSGRRSVEATLEVICAAGSEQVVGRVTCRRCAVGHYARAGGKCAPCEYGSFQGAEGSAECSTCPELYTTAARASLHDEDCVYDGPLFTAIFLSLSRAVWTNVVISYRTFSVTFVLVSFLYLLLSVVTIGLLSYRVHLYRKMRRRRDYALEQLLSLATVGNINLQL